jgi:hypothetical protein
METVIAWIGHKYWNNSTITTVSRAAFNTIRELSDVASLLESPDALIRQSRTSGQIPSCDEK